MNKEEFIWKAARIVELILNTRRWKINPADEKIVWSTFSLNTFAFCVHETSIVIFNLYPMMDQVFQICWSASRWDKVSQIIPVMWNKGPENGCFVPAKLHRSANQRAHRSPFFLKCFTSAVHAQKRNLQNNLRYSSYTHYWNGWTFSLTVTT